MEAGVAVAGRSSFRKPSNASSQRNYRRRSPSSSSRSPSGSPSPPNEALSGGWKRDRSVSPSSPKQDGATNVSLHSKKGKTGHAGKDGSDEDSHGRFGDPGSGYSERHVRGASYDRYGKPDYYESRRSGSFYEKKYQSHDNHVSRDSYGDSRRNGDYDSSVRSRQSSGRRYRESSKSRDKERLRSRDLSRDIERSTKYRTGVRETHSDRETNIEGRIGKDSKDRERDRDRDRERNRERSRGGRAAGRDSYLEKRDDFERRYDGGRSRDSNRDRDRDQDRERVKRRTVRELSIDQEYEAGEIDSERSKERERERTRDRGNGRDTEKLQSKSGGRDLTNPKQSDTESREWSVEKSKENEGEKVKDKAGTSEVNSDVEIGTQKKTRDRTREGGKYRERELVEEKGGRDKSGVEMGREKDIDRSRDRGRVVDRTRDWDYKDPDRGREYSRQVDGSGSGKARDFRSKEQSKDSRLKDEEVYRERSVHRDKEDHRIRDRLREKDDIVPVPERHKPGDRPDYERSGNKGSGNSEQSSHRDRDRINSSGLGKGSGNDRCSSDAVWGKEKTVVKSETGKQQGSRTKEVVGSYNSKCRDEEGGKDQKVAKIDGESAQQASSLPTASSDLDARVTTGSDGKAVKGSKWGPEASDSTIKSSANEELANDLSAAKLAAMKAAELVNKNLGVAGFMSADQKKRLLWGSKKLSAEQPLSVQEPVVAAGTNRWDTVHFSDPDRQEKFQKLMGVKADTCTESKKEGDPEVGAFTEERQRELQQDLEKQFTAGLRRRDGGKVGLGL